MYQVKELYCPLCGNSVLISHDYKWLPRVGSCEQCGFHAPYGLQSAQMEYRRWIDIPDVSEIP